MKVRQVRILTGEVGEGSRQGFCGGDEGMGKLGHPAVKLWSRAEDDTGR